MGQTKSIQVYVCKNKLSSSPMEFQSWNFSFEASITYNVIRKSKDRVALGEVFIFGGISLHFWGDSVRYT